MSKRTDWTITPDEAEALQVEEERRMISGVPTCPAKESKKTNDKRRECDVAHRCAMSSMEPVQIREKAEEEEEEEESREHANVLQIAKRNHSFSSSSTAAHETVSLEL